MTTIKRGHVKNVQHGKHVKRDKIIFRTSRNVPCTKVNHFTINMIVGVTKAQRHQNYIFSQNRSSWASKIAYKTPAKLKIMPVRVPPSYAKGLEPPGPIFITTGEELLFRRPLIQTLSKQCCSDIKKMILH